MSIQFYLVGGPLDGQTGPWSSGETLYYYVPTPPSFRSFEEPPDSSFVETRRYIHARTILLLSGGKCVGDWWLFVPEKDFASAGYKHLEGRFEPAPAAKDIATALNTQIKNLENCVAAAKIGVPGC